jgi:hypothetical protein
MIPNIHLNFLFHLNSFFQIILTNFHSVKIVINDLYFFFVKEVVKVDNEIHVKKVDNTTFLFYKKTLYFCD